MTSVLFAILLACGVNPADKLTSAQDHLAAGAWKEATTAAAEGLAAGAEGTTRWRLELVALEARARGGEDVVATLDRLATEYPAQVKGSLYVQTAGQVREAGDAGAAITVLDAGAKRFPDDADITKAIEQAKAGGDDAELERLRSLGYID